MTPTTKISIALVLAVIACVYQIYSMWSNHKKNENDERIKAIETEKNFLKLDIKLDNVSGNINKLISSDEYKAKQISEISESVVSIREQLKTIFNTIENHEQRLNQIEHKQN